MTSVYNTTMVRHLTTRDTDECAPSFLPVSPGEGLGAQSPAVLDSLVWLEFSSRQATCAECMQMHKDYHPQTVVCPATG